ncbi:peptidylprolyl isomerase [Herbidospora sp. RD11066]
MWKDTPQYLGELLIWEIEDYLVAQSQRPERAKVAFIRLADAWGAASIAAELDDGGSFYSAAKRADAMGMTLPGDMFGTVTREQMPHVFAAVPGTTFPPMPDGDGWVIVRLVAFES